MSKNVLITGGSRGIGYGIAKALAEAGCNLAINGVRPEESVLDELKELRKFGKQVVYCRGDVSSESDRNLMVKEALHHFGELHVLVNNAGVAPNERVDLLEMKPVSYDRVMDINLRGPFFLTQKIANLMIASKQKDAAFEGCIVNISSVSASTASIMRGEYCISKAGMGMMTKLFAVRLGAYDLPVFEVRPGIIETDMTAAVLEKYQKDVEEGLTLQPRLGKPEDVGRAVRALVENKIPYATGQVILIDGGMSIPTL
ncbi:3-ketoacyl-ACP reductase [Pseudozobellia thermophila]|uniref:NAD(P)-dependent dehydrogenase, short-chain alcohol dehydrogenase family n=1 Tax=Pseudozobellia thermophila TaxID=192903 RepID=A0A1M6NY11_9FLAO|nr:3-ketoacyl-ACP reductase [Pseudozobellia thermophila]SHK00531.1 NAD(P)-dependent dehydrogenase, short-chain alcohol dehydrogenase family [Pseudozobellia thermophila]